jgi:aspartyl/asparaginyl beta-hydroxylase (cupin superfamily)
LFDNLLSKEHTTANSKQQTAKIPRLVCSMGFHEKYKKRKESRSMAYGVWHWLGSACGVGLRETSARWK